MASLKIHNLYKIKLHSKKITYCKKIMETSKIIQRGLLLLGIAVLIFFIATLDTKGIQDSLMAIPISQLALLVIVALSMTFLNIFFKAWRWKVLVHSISQASIPLGFSFTSIIAGVAAGSILPGRVELAKPLVLKNAYQVPLSQSLSALVLERVLDLLTLVLFLALSLFFLPPLGLVSINIIFILAVVLLGGIMMVALFPTLLLFLTRKIVSILPLSEQLKLKGITFTEQALLSFGILKSKKSMIYLGLLSIIGNVFEVARFYAVLYYLGIHPSVAVVAFTFISSLLIGVISTIPGGVGVTELSGASLLSQFESSVPASLVKSAVLLDRIISYYLIIVSGSLILIFIRQYKSILKRKEKEEIKLENNGKVNYL
ncbi:TPA: flippase-like domain-containing protein [Candidatus Woesearchaeota archaeon]|nr:flippase-like domain-containing protein [Candidatus Woesearchaeota archaeon]